MFSDFIDSKELILKNIHYYDQANNYHYSSTKDEFNVDENIPLLSLRSPTASVLQSCSTLFVSRKSGIHLARILIKNRTTYWLV